MRVPLALLTQGGALMLSAAIAVTSMDVRADTVKPLKAEPSVAPEGSGVPRSTCRPEYAQQGFWLCMTGARGFAQFDNATIYCQDIGGRVADVSDWRYRIFRGDGVPAPIGWWLGTRTGDDRALFVNSSNVGNFDGEAAVTDNRNFACVHDLLR